MRVSVTDIIMDIIVEIITDIFIDIIIDNIMDIIIDIIMDIIMDNIMDIRLFHRITKCQGDNYTGKNLVPPIKTRSPVVKAVKLMACRQAQLPLKITT